MSIGDLGAILALITAGASSWFTYHSTRKATEGDLTLRGLKQLNDSCMERCKHLEDREHALVERIEELEDEVRTQARLIGVLRGDQR